MTHSVCVCVCVCVFSFIFNHFNVVVFVSNFLTKVA